MGDALACRRGQNAADISMTDRPFVALDSPRIELYLIDCVAGMGQLDPESVSVVVTSPPYNIGVNYKTYDDARPKDEYFAWVRDVGSAIHRVLEQDGSLFLNVGSRPTDPWLAWDVAAQLRGTSMDEADDWTDFGSFGTG